MFPVNFDWACHVISMVSKSGCFIECFIIYRTTAKKLCRMSQHCKSSQTESARVATSKCIKVTTMSLLRDMKLMSRDKSVDLTGVLSCRATLLEFLRQNHLSLRQVPMM